MLSAFPRDRPCCYPVVSTKIRFWPVAVYTDPVTVDFLLGLPSFALQNASPTQIFVYQLSIEPQEITCSCRTAIGQ